MPDRIYRILLLAYPREFRESNGAEMLQVYRDCHGACRNRGGLNKLILFWVGTLWDAISNGILLRLSDAAKVGQIEIHGVAGTSGHWWTGWSKDVRYALRQLRRSPGFSLTVILTLALGLGTNSAMFSLVYGVLIAPLPFVQPERSTVLSEHATGVDSSLVSPVTYADWNLRSRSFAELAAFRFWENRSVELSPTSSIPVLHVTATPNYFPALGWSPLLGRTFGDEKVGGVNEAVLSHRLWLHVFQGDPDAIGKQIRVSGSSFIVVGVMPPSHNDMNLGLADIWTPLHRYNLERQRATSYRDRYLGVIGRLLPGTSLDQAQAEMSALQSQLSLEGTSVAKGFAVRLELLPDAAGRRIRPVLMALFGAVLFVLVIACANVANLMLTRVVARTREHAVRIALGASRLHLARQMLTESLLLASLGGALGLVLAHWTIGLLKLGLADRIPRLATVSVNGPVLAFASSSVILISLLFCLAPLAGFGISNLHNTLKETGRSGSGMARSSGLRSVLVASQVAFAVLLLCSAGLVLKGFAKLLLVDPGFVTENRVVADIILPLQDYATNAKRTSYFRDLFRRLDEQPQFRGAGAALYFPCRPKTWLSTIWIEGSTAEPGSEPIVYFNLFANDYFRTMGIPLKQGRLPREEEMWENRNVLLVNEMLARQLFTSTSALGKRLKTSRDGPWYTVIGVVGDIRQNGLDEAPRAELYQPFSSMPMAFLTVVATARTSVPEAVAALRNVAREGVPGLQIENAALLSQVVENTVTVRRVALVLMILFASLSLTLAGIGTYGVISYSVAQRTQELGLRIALGATAGKVLKLVASQGLGTALCGTAAGLLLTAFAGPAVRTLLYEVSPVDPAVYLTVLLLVLAVVALACVVPALRAVKTDPLISLRGE